MTEFKADITLAQLRAKQGKKWTKYGPDVLAAWVADMDFPVSEPIRRALQTALEHEDYGYGFSAKDGPIPELFAARVKRLYQWDINPAQVEGMCDVVQGIYVTIENFTSPGDGVVTLTPVYPPFLNAVTALGRELLEVPLQREQDFQLDIERLRAAVNKRTRLLLLCHPHNPTGRVFSRDELEKIADFAIEHDLIVLSDEIHAELIYSGFSHIPFASLNAQIAARTITMTSATKSFNTAGLRYAIVFFGSQTLQKMYNRTPERLRGGMNTFGMLATQAAWEHGETWLHELVDVSRRKPEFPDGIYPHRVTGNNSTCPRGNLSRLAGLLKIKLGSESARFLFRKRKSCFK